MKRNYINTIIQFIKFCVVGCSNTILSYVTFFICVKLGVHYLIANLIGFVIGVLNAYFWSNKYIFKVNSGAQRNSTKSLIKTFISYGITGVLLQSILLYLFVEYMKLDSLIAQLICLLITVPLNFILNKFWSFRSL